MWINHNRALKNFITYTKQHFRKLHEIYTTLHEITFVVSCNLQFHAVKTGVLARGLFRTLPNIYDGAFLAKIINNVPLLTTFTKKVNQK